MKTFKQLKEELSKNSDTIVVDGISRSRLNSLGNPIYPTEEGIINFWKWFGNSQVVDSLGRPITMFHGTVTWERKDGRQLGDIHSFNRMGSTDIARRPPSPDTVGSWFSNKVAGGADQYGDTFYPVYLKVLDGKRTTFDGMRSQAYRLDKGFEPSDIHAGYMPDSMEPYRDWLKSEGYDGLNMIHDPSNRNSSEFQNQVVYVVLEPNQIKSAIGNKGSFNGSSDKIVEAELFHESLKESSNIGWIGGIPIMNDVDYKNLIETFPNVRFKALTESGIRENNKFPSWDNVWQMDKHAPLNTYYTDIINESVDEKVIAELFDPIIVSYGTNHPKYDDSKTFSDVTIQGNKTINTVMDFNGVDIGVCIIEPTTDDYWEVVFIIIDNIGHTESPLDRMDNNINSIKNMPKFYSGLAYVIKSVVDSHQQIRRIKFNPSIESPQGNKLTSLYSKFIESKSFQKMITNLGWKHIKNNRYIRAADKIVDVEVNEKHMTEDVNIKPLYVHRPLLNPQPLIKWANEQGFSKTLAEDDFHVTIVYSKKPINWNKFEPDQVKFKNAIDDRAMDKFGDAVVLKFSSPMLVKRHDEFKEGGASWDYPDYQPHITITYDGGDIDVKALQPYTGVLAFGPEEFEDLDEDWSESIDEVVA